MDGQLGSFAWHVQAAEAGGLACTDVTPENFLFDMGVSAVYIAPFVCASLLNFEVLNSSGLCALLLCRSGSHGDLPHVLIAGPCYLQPLGLL